MFAWMYERNKGIFRLYGHDTYRKSHFNISIERKKNQPTTSRCQLSFIWPLHLSSSKCQTNTLLHTSRPTDVLSLYWSRKLTLYFELSWKRERERKRTRNESHARCVCHAILQLFHILNKCLLEKMRLSVTWASISEGDVFFWQLLSSSQPLGELATWWQKHLLGARGGKGFILHFWNEPTKYWSNMRLLLAPNALWRWRAGYQFSTTMQVKGETFVADDALDSLRGGARRSGELGPFSNEMICSFISV